MQTNPKLGFQKGELHLQYGRNVWQLRTFGVGQCVVAVFQANGGDFKGFGEVWRGWCAMGEALKRNTRALNLFKPKIRHAKPWPKDIKANPNAHEKI